MTGDIACPNAIRIQGGDLGLFTYPLPSLLKKREVKERELHPGSLGLADRMVDLLWSTAILWQEGFFEQLSAM